MNTVSLFYVFLGGGIGAVLRYASSQWMLSFDSLNSRGHWATFVVNLMASIALVLAYKYAAERPAVLLLLATGLCGGWSTFSTFSYETALLFHQGRGLEACIYVLASTVIGIGVVYLIAERILWIAPK